MKINTSTMSVEAAAFQRLRDALDAAPKPRHATERDWETILGAYNDWKDSLGPHDLTGFRSEQQAIRGRKLAPYMASPRAIALDEIERHRGRHHARRRVENGKNAERERSRREADPEAYMAGAAQRQRDRRARLRAVIDVTDARAWKAPEARL